MGSIGKKAQRIIWWVTFFIFLGIIVSLSSCPLPAAARNIAPPVFTPPGGMYPADQNVMLACPISDASIHYTIDGSDPDNGSTLYTSSIPIIGQDTNITIKAIAIKNEVSSTISAATYLINYQIAAPQFNLQAGTYDDDISITLSCPTSGVTIYYTTNGNDPTISSASYSTAIPINGHGTTMTIKAIAEYGGVVSLISSATYNIVYQVSVPWFSPAAGTYTSDQSVVITCPTSGTTIHYTTDGSTPTAVSPAYTGSIPVAGDEKTVTIKAIATKGGAESTVSSGTYTIYYSQVAAPQFSLASGTYYSTQTVSISSITPAATIYYTMDGSIPTTSSEVYHDPIVFNTECGKRIRAFAVKGGKTDSSITTGTYMIILSNVPEWAKTSDSGGYSSNFKATAVDSSGNIFAAGYINENERYDFGNGVFAQGVGGIVLVKYDSAGTAQWARTMDSGSANSCFNALAVDPSGNVYAAGYITGVSTFGFGNGITTQGIYSGSNILLVKYDTSGTALWAQSVPSGSNETAFNSIAVDSLGNIIAAGYMSGTGTFGFGNACVVQGTSNDKNILLIKYDNTGNTQWATSVSSGSNTSQLSSVAVDPSGNVYVAGYFRGTSLLGFGNGISLQGASNYKNVLLVKYNSEGLSQWGCTLTVGSSDSFFSGVTVDALGNIYAVGTIYLRNLYGFGNSVTVQSTSDISFVLVKYDNVGSAQWARSVSSGDKWSGLNSVALDPVGCIITGGYIVGIGSCGFGNGVYISGYSDYDNVLLIKYDSDGAARSAQTTTYGGGLSKYSSIAIDLSGNIYAAGAFGWGTYGFGNGVTTQGIRGVSINYSNPLLVKY